MNLILYRKPYKLEVADNYILYVISYILKSYRCFLIQAGCTSALFRFKTC